MKNLICKWAVVWVAGSLLCSSAWAQNRIATVDLGKVFDKYWKTKQADVALKERAAGLEKEHADLIKDYKKAKEEYQTLLADANNQAISSDERDKRKKSAEEKLRQIKENEETITTFERTARTTIEDQKKRMRENIVEEIRNVLDAKAKAANYLLVVDTAANSVTLTPIVLYSSKENDLTEDLLKQLNANDPSKDAAKSGTSPADKKDEKKK